MSLVLFRKGIGKHELPMDATDVERDLITPLLPGSSTKEIIKQLTEPDPVISVPREVSKLGLFTLTGMAIVLFQVNR